MSKEILVFMIQRERGINRRQFLLRSIAAAAVAFGVNMPKSREARAAEPLVENPMQKALSEGYVPFYSTRTDLGRGLETIKKVLVRIDPLNHNILDYKVIVDGELYPPIPARGDASKLFA